MLKDFKAFILRGNVVDLAVGIVIGAAFGAVVSSFVKDLITPLVAIPSSGKKQQSFASLYFVIHGSKFAYGDFVNSIVSFVIVAAAIFFLVVKPINALTARRRRGQEEEPGTRACPECLSDVPTRATRCAFCTSVLTPAA
ncbi:MAG: large conductance mechanosensitive channel protein MscL [Acidimicrobiales bacterium]